MNNLRKLFAVCLMLLFSATYANAQKSEKNAKLNGLTPKHSLVVKALSNLDITPNNNPQTPTHSSKDPWDIVLNANIAGVGEAGVETDGNYIYSSKWSGAIFYRYTMTGTLVDSFSVPTVTGIRDLAYDGTYFYGGANAATIYKMDFVNHTLIGTIACPAGTTVRNIAYDYDLNGFWVGGWSSDIICVSPTGTVLNTIPTANHALTGIYGSAYDNYSPGGPYLWLFDQGSAGDGAFFNQISIATLLPTGLVHDCSDISATAMAGGAFCFKNTSGQVILGGNAQGEKIFAYELIPSITHCDITPNMLIAPLNSDLLTAANAIQVKVSNNDSLDHSNIPISYVIDGGTPVNDIITSTINGGSFVNFTFLQTADFSIPGHVYDIEIYTAYACDTTNNNDTLSTTVYNNFDAQALSIDVAPVINNGTVNPMATVKNTGSIDIAFNATMVIGTYTSTKNAAILAPGATQQLTFDPWNAANGTYNIKVYTQLGNDMNLTNDTLEQSVEVLDLTKAYCYVASDPSGILPEGPAVTSLEAPGAITSLADNTGQNFVGAGTWGRGNKWYGVVYADNTLITIDTLTGARTVIGNVGLDIMGLTYDYTSNKLFGTGYSGSTSSLYSISPATGNTNLIGSSSSDVLINLACDTFGNLYSLGINDDLLYSVNKNTGIATSIGAIGFDASYAQDMEFDRYTNICYLAGYNAATSAGDLSFVNVVTGAATHIGDFAGGSEITGFAIPFNSSLATNDASITGYTSPESACGLGNEAISVSIENLGTSAISGFPVSYKINSSAPVTETVSSVIAPGAAYTYTFTQQANLSAPGVFNIKVYSALTNDEYPANDTISIAVENVTNAIPPYGMGFEPAENFSGWQIENTNGDANTWAVEATGGNIAPAVATYNYTAANGANDWLISKCIQLDATKTYKLSYWYKAKSASYPESMSVYIGTAPVSTSLTTLLSDLPSITTVTYTEDVVNFTVPTSGVYYLGWLCNSAADMYVLYLDDINLTDATGIEEVSASATVSAYPNPAGDKLNVKSTEKIVSIKIYNPFGQLVYSNLIDNKNATINTSNLADGFYYLNVETASGVSTQKIAVKK